MRGTGREVCYDFFTGHKRNVSRERCVGRGKKLGEGQWIGSNRSFRRKLFFLWGGRGERKKGKRKNVPPGRIKAC